jgi:hypothetical protein
MRCLAIAGWRCARFSQTKNIAVRLMVRPGVTGWAQVNGGVLLSPDEKERLDEWYIRNASPWLDLRIVFMTAIMFVRGDRRTPQVEQTVWTNSVQINEPQPRRMGVQRTAVHRRRTGSWRN